MSRGGRRSPFVLTARSGNPHLVYFRPRGGDPLGDAESFNIALVRARTPAADLLFIGGDFNNQRFVAYRRAPSPREIARAIPKEAQPIVDWMRAIVTSDLELFKTSFSKRMRVKLEREGWEETLRKYHDLFATTYEALDLSAIVYEVKRQGERTKVSMTYEETSSLGALRVTEEDGAWKLDER